MTSMATASYPSPQSQSQTSPLDGNMHQTLQIGRLNSENARLSEENTRLSAEIQRLKEEREQERASGASAVPPDMIAPIGHWFKEGVYIKSMSLSYDRLCG